jgi:FkbM family methyltransferase
MITLAEHTIEETIIDKNGYILDLGCVNFGFTLEMKELCNNIICVDPNPKIKKAPEGIIYERAAISHDSSNQITEFFIYSDNQGCSLLNPEKDWCHLIGKIEVPLLTIKDVMKKYNIKQFELIKFDIEGGEYKILENIDWTISKQYSVEFHDFRFMNPNYPDNQLYYERIFENMLKYCDIKQHEITDHEGFPMGLGRNYWDSLFVLKKEFYK